MKIFGRYLFLKKVRSEHHQQLNARSTNNNELVKASFTLVFWGNKKETTKKVRRTFSCMTTIWKWNHQPCMSSSHAWQVYWHRQLEVTFEYTNLGMNGFKNRDSHSLPMFFKEQFENLYLQETSSKDSKVLIYY